MTESTRVRAITKEYIKFLKETQSLVNDVKRTTCLAIKVALSLEDGDIIQIFNDGSLEIETQTKGKMPNES